MSDTIIEIKNLSKRYSLGTIGTGTLYGDLNRFWAKISGKEDPYNIIGGESNKEKSDFWALSNISFNVNAGEILGIIGKNGAGKSTLLKILSRTTSPTSGNIKIYGRVASLLEVGTGFHPELTGRENIYLNGAILGMKKPEIKSKFDEIVDFAGVEKFIDTPVKRYSSGMYVRLAFAVAAHLDPEILIIDEVLAVGDVDFQRKCLGKMQDISRNEGRTVLFVSHNFGAIESLCKSAIHLDKGMISFHGGVKESIQSFHNSYNLGNNSNLLQRTDRRGSGLIKFTEVELLDQNLEQILYALSGQNIVLRIRVDNQSQEIFQKNIQIDVAINSSLGEPLVWLSTSLMDSFITIKPGIGFIDLHIFDISLIPGMYQLTLFCKSNGEILDWVSEAFSLEIEIGDYYLNGRFHPFKYGNFMIRHTFKSVQ